jgi:lysine-N-methylase
VKKKFTALMLAPRYVSQFQCAGGDCPDTCCQGWTITVDKETFGLYRSVIHPELKPWLDTNLVLFDQNSEENYGKFKRPPDNDQCGMLSEQRLCRIQQHLGEDALSDTCYIYPRTVYKSGDQFAQCLTLSCPEAARLALTQDDAFEFAVTEFTSRQDTTRELIRSLHGFDAVAMEETRVFCIQLFQTEALSNTERLVMLGWLCHQLDALAASNSQAQALDLLQQLTHMVESGNLRTSAAQLTSQPRLAAEVFSLLFGSPLGKGASERQREVVSWVCHGLGFVPGNAAPQPATIAENYLRGLSLLNSQAAQLEQMLERYLLNELLLELFPWSRTTMMAHYRRLLTRYGVLRLMLAAVANAKSAPLDMDTIVQVIQVFSRQYQHNKTFSTRAEDLLNSANWTQLDRLYALL